MEKALIIYNPMAGSENGEKLANLFKERLEKDFDEIDIKGTKEKGDATFSQKIPPMIVIILFL